MSFTPAQAVTSPQTGVHKNLEKTVRKHFASESQKPIAAHNQAAFEQASQWLKDKGWQQGQQPEIPLILDSACGTGQSSRHWAKAYPDHLVIGLDQSIKRLQNSQNAQLPPNCLLLHCECTDFWRLAQKAGWVFDKHTLLYPNPYPKTQHLQRRWHGEAAFPSLLAISKAIELRSNWPLYVEEFFQALNIAADLGLSIDAIHMEHYQPQQTITAFEQKYQLSGHSLWRVQAIIQSGLG